jgi:hypothetical protein
MKNKNMKYIIIITIILLFIFLIYLTYNDDKNIENFGIIDMQNHAEKLNKDIQTLDEYFSMKSKDQVLKKKIKNIKRTFNDLNNSSDIKYYIDLVIEIKNLECYLLNDDKYKSKKHNHQLHNLLENITKGIENINKSFSDIKNKSTDLITTLYTEMNKNPKTISRIQNNIENIFQDNKDLKNDFIKILNNKNIMSKYNNLLSDNPNNNNVSNFNNNVVSSLSSVTSSNPL